MAGNEDKVADIEQKRTAMKSEQQIINEIEELQDRFLRELDNVVTREGYQWLRRKYMVEKMQTLMIMLPKRYW